jgi:aspartate-semialdehyde dehydrogenase
VFGRQLAFNLIPSPAEPSSRSEGDGVEGEVRRITGGEYDLAVQTILAPVFHCHAAAVHVVLPSGRGPEDLAAALRAGEDLKLPPRGGVTPVERAGKAEVAVAGVRPSSVPRGAWIWAVADNLTAGTARNAVRIAEGLMSRNLARRPS